MGKTRDTGHLQNIIKYDNNDNLDFAGSGKFSGDITVDNIPNATTDTDKFLVSDGGVVKYRTGAEMLSDLGVAPGAASNIQHQVKAGVAINKGQAVYVTSADGTNMVVGLASNSSEATSSKTMGLLASTVSTNGFANVIAEGLLSGLNTMGATAGDPVWLGTGGNLIYGLLNKPYAPAHLVFIGIVTRVNSNNGEIFVKVQNGFELNEIHDVDLKTTVPINGDVLGFDGTLWVNKTIAGWLGYTPWHPGNDGSGSGLDADLLDGYHASAFQLALTNPVTGTGTTNYVSKFTSATTLGDSQIFDNGTNVGIGTSSPSGRLQVASATAGDDQIWLQSTTYTGGYSTLGYNANTGEFRIKQNDGGSAGITFYTGVSASEKMRITPSGNVGIGTSSPSGKLHVAGVDQLLDDGTNGRITLEINSGQNDIYSTTTSFGAYKNLRYTANDHYFRNAGTEVMRLTGGNVGIGTSSPSEKLEVQNAGSGAKIKVSNSAGGYASLECSSNASSVAQLSFTNQLSLIGGNVGIGTSSPDAILDVNGDALINRVTIGQGPAVGQQNTALGRGALSSMVYGSANIAIGDSCNMDNDATGLTTIGVELNTNTNLDPLNQNCLAISQYNSNAYSNQVPHIYAPRPIAISSGTTDIISFDVNHYAGAIVEYMIRLDDGGDYALGTVYMGWRSGGSGTFRDNREIEWSDMSGFVFSLGGSGQTLVLTNTSGDNAWIRITVRGMMTN
jgi:hypothetical protein